MLNATRTTSLAALFIAATLCNAAFAQKPANDQALKSATETAKKIQDTTGAKPADSKVPPGDPCAILSLADVQKVFPAVKSSERSRRLEQYGITECAWKGADGGVLVGVQEQFSKGTAKDDAEGMSAGIVDPFKPQARRSVRFETLPGVGVDTVAFVEKADAQRGILSDGAMIFMRQGDHTVRLMSADLPGRDRTAALKALEDLGKVAAKRLK
jgi:hypothetical protein